MMYLFLKDNSSETSEYPVRYVKRNNASNSLTVRLKVC